MRAAVLGSSGRAGLLALALLLLAGSAPARAAIGAGSLVDAVGAIAITVSDTNRAIAFYRDVLTFEVVSDVEVWGEPYERLFGLFGIRLRLVRMRLGDEAIELIEVLTPRGRPIPVDSRSNDRWFQHVAIVVTDMEIAFTAMRTAGADYASPAPQRLPDWNPNAGGIEAFYFRDPDGNNLELLAFPPDKGDAKWRRPSNRLFLGIDHTAITVASTAQSLAFYRDRLGLAVVGTSENHGPEQERLNNVFGARLRVTALRAARGPGIELLEYLTPRSGRPMPADTEVNDLWHWHVDLRTERLDGVEAALRMGGGRLVSPQPVSLPNAEPDPPEGLMARDPDGHAVLLLSR